MKRRGWRAPVGRGAACVVVALGFFFGGAACGPTSSPRAARTAPVASAGASHAARAEHRQRRPLQLRFVGDAELELVDGFVGAPVGGLSGLIVDADGSFLAVSDDRGEHGPTRLVRGAVRFTADERGAVGVAVEAHGDQSLFGAGPAAELDLEAIARLPSGNLWLASEGSREPRHGPELLRFGADGQLLCRQSLPSEFEPSPGQGSSARGAQPNRAVEGLTVSPSGHFGFALLEGPLAQDGPNAPVRLLRYSLAETGCLAPAPTTFFVELGPLPALGALVPTKPVELGASEVLALDDQRLLVLERAAVFTSAGVQVLAWIRELTLPPNGAGIEGSQPWKRGTPTAARRSVFDLTTLAGRLHAGLGKLDNVEGLALGPRLPSGERSLLLLTDDNFSSSQRTVLLVFALVE